MKGLCISYLINVLKEEKWAFSGLAAIGIIISLFADSQILLYGYVVLLSVSVIYLILQVLVSNESVVCWDQYEMILPISPYKTILAKYVFSSIFAGLCLFYIVILLYVADFRNGSYFLDLGIKDALTLVCMSFSFMLDSLAAFFITSHGILKIYKSYRILTSLIFSTAFLTFMIFIANQKEMSLSIGRIFFMAISLAVYLLSYFIVLLQYRIRKDQN